MKNSLSDGEFYYGAKHIETLSDVDDLFCIIDAQPPGSMRQAAINRLFDLEKDAMYFIASLTDIERLKKINRTRVLGSLFLSVATGRLKVLSEPPPKPKPSQRIEKPIVKAPTEHSEKTCGCVYIGLREWSCGFKVAA